jgi:hypothetical protein
MNTDGAIFNHIMRTNREDVLNGVEEDHVFIVHRGFWNSITYLKLGIEAVMSAFMQKGEKQMSTEDANTSRLVTKVHACLKWN